MLRTVFRRLSLSTQLHGGERRAKLDAKRAAMKNELPKLKLRKVPYFRKGTKVELRPHPKTKREQVMINITRVHEPNSYYVSFFELFFFCLETDFLDSSSLFT